MSEEVQAYFERVAGEWDDLRADYFPDLVRGAVMAAIRPTAGMAVADVGCGNGFLGAGLAPLVSRLCCLDASAGMLGVARRNLASFANMVCLQGQGATLPLADGSLDAVVANMYLHHAPDPALALREMARVLRPGGRLVLSDMEEHEEDWMREAMADLWLGFSRAQLRGWLEDAGLVAVTVDACDHG